MSLINQMLRDIDLRERDTSTESEVHEATATTMTFPKGRCLLIGLVSLSLIALGFIISRQSLLQKLTPSAMVIRTVKVPSPVASVEMPQPVKVAPEIAVEKAPIPAPVAITELVRVRSSHQADGGRLVFELNQNPTYTLVQNQSQFQIQLEGNWRWPQEIRWPHDKGALLQQVHHSDGKLVLDLKLPGPSNVNAFVLAHTADYGHRLVVDYQLLPHKDGSKAKPDVVTARPTLTANPEPQAKASSRVATQTESTEPKTEARVKRSFASSLDRARNAKAAGSTTTALQAYQQFTDQHPLRTDARLEFCRLLISQGQRVKAENKLRDGLELTPKADPLRLELTRLLLKAGRNEEAGAVLFEVVPTSQTTDRLALEGVVLQKNGSYMESLERYQQLMQIHPQHRWVLGAGIAAEGAGQWRQAQLAYKQLQNDQTAESKLRSYARVRLQAIAVHLNR